MPNRAHDVRLLPLFIDGVTHGLAINGQAFVFLAEGRIPLLQGVVELCRIDPDQHIANDRFTGDEITPVFSPTTKAFAGLGAQVVRPSGDGFIPAHTAQDSPDGDAEHNRESMPPTLGTTWIGDGVKEVGQGAHLFSSQHDLRWSGAVNGIKKCLREVRPCITLQRADEDAFWPLWPCAVTLASTTKSLR